MTKQNKIKNTNTITEEIKTRDPRLPLAGSIITRKYKGKDIIVKVLDNGFEYKGKTYKSISALAVAIVKCPISGYVFFKLGNKNVK